MPTYEYRCSAGHEFEHFQRMSEEALHTCTICGAPVERLLSTGAGLLFKGSGFYITDYRSDSYRKAAEADNAPKPAEASTGTGESGKPSSDAAKSGDTGSKAGASSKREGGGTGGSGSGSKDSGSSATSSKGE